MQKIWNALNMTAWVLIVGGFAYNISHKAHRIQFPIVLLGIFILLVTYIIRFFLYLNQRN